jgi:predicted Zn-dependent protease
MTPSRSTTLVRAALVLLALLACAWLLVQWQVARTTEDAKRIALAPTSREPELARALADARDPGPLNPDPAATQYYQALLQVRTGDVPGAIRTVQSIVREQPRFAEAWFLLSQISESSEPRISAEALERVRALDPLIAAKARR